MAAKMEYVTCKRCLHRAKVPHGVGLTWIWAKNQGWGVTARSLYDAKCPRCMQGRPGARTEPTAADVAYAKRMAKRRDDEEAFKAEVFAQHHAAKPHQPEVEKVLARKPIAEVSGVGKFGGK